MADAVCRIMDASSYVYSHASMTFVTEVIFGLVGGMARCKERVCCQRTHKNDCRCEHCNSFLCGDQLRHLQRHLCPQQYFTFVIYRGGQLTLLARNFEVVMDLSLMSVALK